VGVRSRGLQVDIGASWSLLSGYSVSGPFDLQCPPSNVPKLSQCNIGP